MERFDRILDEDIKDYHGHDAHIIRQAPAFYRLMSRLLSDPRMPRSLWQLVIAAIAYFILPEDVIPEKEKGPEGYIDDIYLSALVADKVRQALGSDDILTSNWDGDWPIVPLIEEIIAREGELMGESKEVLLTYIGFDELCQTSE